MKEYLIIAFISIAAVAVAVAVILMKKNRK